MTVYAGATVDVLDSLGLDPATDGPLIEWQDSSGGLWVTDADRSHALVSYATSYGRTDARSKVPPIQCAIRAARALSTVPDIGDVFRLALCTPAALALGLDADESARFTGEVTDLSLDRATWTAVAVGTGARRGRPILDLTGRPDEAASTRVSAILAAEGVTADVGTVDSASVILASPDNPAAGNALTDLVADSTYGQLVQGLDGVIDWHGPEHRRGLVSGLTLTTAEILRDITWAKRVGSVVNIVTVNYVGGSITVTDPASVDSRGPYPITLTTALTDASDAHGLGTLIVGRFNSPTWDLPVLPVDVARTVDPAKLATLLTRRHGHRITLGALPDDGPITGDFDCFVEGVSDNASRWAWRLGFSVSDPAISGVGLRWIDVDPTLTWGAPTPIDPTLRWLDLAGEESPEPPPAPPTYEDILARIVANGGVIRQDIGFEDTSGAVATATIGANGTYVNSPALGQPAGLNDAGSFSFRTARTSSQDCTIPKDTTGGLNSWCVNFWFQYQGNNDGFQIVLMRDSTSTSSQGFSINLFAANPTVKVNGPTTGFSVTGITSASLLDGNWHMATLRNTFVSSSLGNCDIFFDGVYYGTFSRGSSTSYSTNWNGSTHLGRNGTSSQYVSMAYDHWNLFAGDSGAVLPTDDDIADLYTAGTTP